MAVVTVAGPPARINRELGQIGEPVSDSGRVNSGGGAAVQSAKRIEICRSLSVRHQIRIHKLSMSDLIVSIIVDVLSHIRVQHREVGSVGWITCAAWDFGIL